MNFYLDKRLSKPGLLSIAIVLALLVHFIARQLNPFYESAGEEKKAEKSIEIVPLPKEYRKPVVETSRAKSQAEDSSIKPRFAGEFRNRVEKEMQSPIKNNFRQSQRAAGAGKEGAGKQGTPGLSLSDLMPFSSSTPYLLPKEIANGSETLLNTEEVHYASFMNRVAEAVYGPWVRFVRQALREIGRGRFEATAYVTRLDVVLNPDGKIITIKVLRSCGVGELDEAGFKPFGKKSLPFVTLRKSFYRRREKPAWFTISKFSSAIQSSISRLIYSRQKRPRRMTRCGSTREFYLLSSLRPAPIIGPFEGFENQQADFQYEVFVKRISYPKWILASFGALLISSSGWADTSAANADEVASPTSTGLDDTAGADSNIGSRAGNRSGTYGGHRSGSYGGYRSGTYGGHRAGTYGGNRSGTYGGHRSGTYGGHRSGTYGGHRSGTYGGHRSGTYGGHRSGTYGGHRSGTYGGHRSGTYGGHRSGTYGGHRSGTYGSHHGGTHGGTHHGVDPSQPVHHVDPPTLMGILVPRTWTTCTRVVISATRNRTLRPCTIQRKQALT